MSLGGYAHGMRAETSAAGGLVAFFRNLPLEVRDRRNEEGGHADDKHQKAAADIPGSKADEADDGARAPIAGHGMTDPISHRSGGSPTERRALPLVTAKGHGMLTGWSGARCIR